MNISDVASDSFCNPVFSIKLYENTFDSQNPDSFFYNKKDAIIK